jgi:hypothetical protein
MDEARNYSFFPDDDSGDALWRMYTSGDDLTKKREFDFWIIFPKEAHAIDFAVNGLKKGWKVSASKNDHEHFTWQVGVHVVLSAAYKEITDFEDELQRLATLSSGQNDGWGCFEA